MAGRRRISVLALSAVLGAVLLTGCAQPGLAPATGSVAASDPSPSDVYYSSALPTARVEMPRGVNRPEGAPATPDAELTGEQLDALLMSAASVPSTDSSCTAADLRLSLDSPDAASGHHFGRLLATNISGRSCEVQGWPGMGIRGEWGTPFTIVVGQNQPDPNPIGVAPADPEVPVVIGVFRQAAATLEWTGSLGGAYDEHASLLVVQFADGQHAATLPLMAENHVDIGPETTVRIAPWGHAREG